MRPSQSLLVLLTVAVLAACDPPATDTGIQGAVVDDIAAVADSAKVRVYRDSAAAILIYFDDQAFACIPTSIGKRWTAVEVATFGIGIREPAEILDPGVQCDVGKVRGPTGDELPTLTPVYMGKKQEEEGLT